MSLLDKEWENVQKKVFTRWMNSYAKKKGFQIEDIGVDFEDGTKLIQFMEAIAGETLGRYNQNPRMKIQKIENLNTVVRYIESKGIRLNNIGSEDIHEGNLKLIMGLIWMLILRFQVEDISEGDLRAKEALLLWCQRKTEPYDNVNVENFHRSWQDGLAFCALIHAHRPGLIDYANLNADDAMGNLNLAFQVAEEHLGVDQLLDAEDIVNTAKPDERSIIAYVSSLYKVFAGDKQTEDAARRIKNLVEFMNMVESMKGEYNGLASDLLDWIKQKIPYMEDREYDGTIEHLMQLVQDMNDYKGEEKINKEKEKDTLENILSTLNMKLKNANRSAWEPESELSVDNLNGLWDNLMAEEAERDKWLRDELARKQKLKKFTNRFGDKAAQLEKWIKEKDAYLSNEDKVNSLSDANNKLKKAQAFPKEYAKSEQRLGQVKRLCDQIVELDTDQDHIAEVTARTAKIEEDWSALSAKSDAKIADLTEKVAIEKKKEDLRNQWANEAQEYIAWSKKASNEIGNREFGNTLEDVEAFGETLEGSENDYTTTSDEKKASLNAIWDELQALGVNDNPYSAYNMEDVNEVGENLKSDLEKRRTAYDEELERQKNMEAKRIEFAEAADAFVAHLETRTGEVAAAFGDADYDAAIEAVNSTWNNGEPENLPINNLQKIANELLKMGVRQNKHTSMTMPALNKLRKQFDLASKDKLKILHDEKELKEEYTKKSTKLSEWIATTLETLAKEFDNTLAGAKQIYNDWNVYKSQDSAEAENDHQNLSLLYKKIQTLLEKNNRPQWDVTEEALNTQFETLTSEEDVVENSITAELERQESIEGLKRRFDLAVSSLDSFISGKEEEFAREEQVQSLKGARLHVKLLNVANREIKSKQSRLNDMISLKEKLVDLNAADSETIISKADELAQRWEGLGVTSEAKKEVLEASVSVEKGKEVMRLNFAELARDFNRFVKQRSEELADHYFGETLEGVEKAGDKVESKIAGINEKVASFQEKIAASVAELQEAGIEENKHTDITVEDINELENDLSQAIDAYKAAYDETLEKQKHNDQRRIEWAEKAQAFADWIDAQREQLNAVEGDADEKIAKINEIYGSEETGNGQFTEVQELLNSLEEEGIFGNNHTRLSGSILQGRLKAYNSFVENYLAEIANEKKVEERRLAKEAEMAKKAAIEELRFSFEEKEDDVKAWIQNAQDKNTDENIVSSVEEIEAIVAEFQQFLQTAEQEKNTIEELNSIAAQLGEHGVEQSVDVAEAFEETVGESNTKLEELNGQVEYQKEQAASTAEYQSQVSSIETVLEQVRTLLQVQDDSLEEAVRKTTEAVSKLEEQKDAVSGLSSIWSELDQAHRNSVLSQNELTATYQSLVENAHNAKDEAIKEQLAKSESNISPEDLAEFRETFDFFDKNKDGTLSPLDFYGVLTALGETPTEESAAALFSTLDDDNTGTIDFEEFSEFMIAKRKDTDSQSQLQDSFFAVTGGADFITEDQLKLLLPADQLSQIVQNMPLFNGEEGKFDYKAWLSAAYN